MRNAFRAILSIMELVSIFARQISLETMTPDYVRSWESVLQIANHVQVMRDVLNALRGFWYRIEIAWLVIVLV